MSEVKAACLVCKYSPAEPVCPNCGVDAGKLLDVIQAWPRPDLSLSFFVSKEHLARAQQQSEQVWALLSQEFRDGVLAQYHALLDRKSRVTDGTMVAINLVCFASGYLLGSWFLNSVLIWDISLLTQTVFATVVAFFVALVIGALVEHRLLRSRAAVALRDYERSFRLIGLALLKRTHVAFYQHPDFLFPFSAVCGIVIGMAL